MAGPASKTGQATSDQNRSFQIQRVAATVHHATPRDAGAAAAGSRASAARATAVTIPSAHIGTSTSRPRVHRLRHDHHEREPGRLISPSNCQVAKPNATAVIRA